MCGITGCVGTDETVPTLLTGLANLEYRGYDSAGVAVTHGEALAVQKCEGRVADLRTAVETDWPLAGDGGGPARGTDTFGGVVPADASVGIGHTRWSTHGEPSDANAHPHTDCEGEVAVVHNGIIENHDELRDRLVAAGHTFSSETDTEVIPHLVEEALADGADPEEALRTAVAHLEGSYAVAVVGTASPSTVYATRQGSPLVFGVGEDAYYLASDLPAFLEFTDEVVYLEDGDVVAVDPGGYRLTTVDGEPVNRPVERVEWTAQEVQKGQFDHFMLKEIHEQPTALRQSVQGRLDAEAGTVSFDSLSDGLLEGVETVQFVACGTSYHAARYAAQLLRNRGVPARTYLASEYAVASPPPRENALLVGVTQSGETADTLAALRRGRSEGLATLAVTNVVGSTAARECSDALFIRAGPEIGVAATKTFSSQVATLSLLAERLTVAVTGEPGEDREGFLAALEALPGQVRSLLDDDDTPALARRFSDSDGYFFVGRATGRPVALEGALKLKEISYEHAEGFPAGELKHGPLALVTPGTPVFAVATGEHPEKLRGTIEEVAARGAPVVAVTSPARDSVVEAADETLLVPETHEELTGLLANVRLQLLSYYTATQLDRPVDKPRNLAKSVTVE